MDREEWIKEARRGFGPPMQGNGAIYGSQAGKDDAAGQLTRLIDGQAQRSSVDTVRAPDTVRDDDGIHEHLGAALPPLLLCCM